MNTITLYGIEYDLTPERIRRIESALTETQNLLAKEQRYLEDLQHKDVIDSYNAHIAKLQAMLSQPTPAGTATD